MAHKTQLPVILKKHETEILADWTKEQAGTRQQGTMKTGELEEQSREFVRLLQKATQSGNLDDIQRQDWDEVRDFLTSVTKSRTLQGMSATEIATFILSLKRPLFARLKKEVTDTALLADEVWVATELLDKLGLFVTENHQKVREDVIARQQSELLELSTPVVMLWDGILALPLIGTLDSARTQVVMEALLQKIVETGSDVAIIDITGVPTVDTLVAQHLLKTVTAARLMGAECIISGIRPQIAQTIVHLGVELGNVVTKSNLKDAFGVALHRTGQTVTRVKKPTIEE